MPVIYTPPQSKRVDVTNHGGTSVSITGPAGKVTVVSGGKTTVTVAANQTIDVPVSHAGLISVTELEG